MTLKCHKCLYQNLKEKKEENQNIFNDKIKEQNQLMKNNQINGTEKNNLYIKQ